MVDMIARLERNRQYLLVFVANSETGSLTQHFGAASSRGRVSASRTDTRRGTTRSPSEA